MITKALATTVNGTQVWMTPAQAEALTVLEEAQRGGIAAVTGYIPKTGYVQSPIKNMQILTRFSYTKLLSRRIAALEAMTFDDVQPNIKGDKLTSLTEDSQRELFVERKKMELDSMSKTLSGDRSDAHRQGHDRCYARFAEGVKVHYVTEKGTDGLMHPVLTDGHPTAKSVMVHYLELNSTIVQEGVRKVVNSGAPVLMGNAIRATLNRRSVEVRALSLGEDNFERLSINREVILPEGLGDVA